MSQHARLIGSLLGASLLALAPTAAHSQTFADVQAGLGYSTNPQMELGGDSDSGFGRVSVYGYHGWKSERGETSVSAFVENSSYFRRYGSKQLFDVTARNMTQASETVRLFGSVGFSGDFGAQLSSRFFGAPLQTTPLNPIGSPITDVVVTPDLAALNQRQYRIVGQGGASFVLSPRDAISTTIGAQRVFFSNDNSLLDYYRYTTSTAFQRQVDERFAVGARFTADYADYRRGRSITGYGPQIIAVPVLAKTCSSTARSASSGPCAISDRWAARMLRWGSPSMAPCAAASNMSGCAPASPGGRNRR